MKGCIWLLLLGAILWLIGSWEYAAIMIVVFMIIIIVAIIDKNKTKEKELKEEEERKQMWIKSSMNIKPDDPAVSAYDIVSGTNDKIVEVSYHIPWMDSAEETVNINLINLSEKDIDRLLNAEKYDEMLSSDYLSVNLKSIHEKIIKAIRNDMEEKSMNPGDGLVVIEKHSPPCFTKKVLAYRYPSYEDMLMDAEDEDIDYFVTIY
ncbi:MAG: hypothetical protein IKW78_07355 [Prevotella sp.]|nr:hypothetical protein [Prevotella sp.]